MKYFKLLFDYEHDRDYVYCNRMNLEESYRYIESAGEKIVLDNKIKLFIDDNSGNVFPDYLPNCYCWFIISEKFKEIISRLMEINIQFLKVSLTDPTGNELLNKYYVANILDIVDAIDLKESEYDIYSYKDIEVYSFRKYALQSKMLNDKHIFRLKKSTIPIFVSEQFKKLVQKHHLSGVDFLEVKIV